MGWFGSFCARVITTFLKIKKIAHIVNTAINNQEIKACSSKLIRNNIDTIRSDALIVSRNVQRLSLGCCIIYDLQSSSGIIT